MARGGPDWYGLTGVTFGSMNKLSWGVPINFGTDEDIFSFTGRGALLGGFVYCAADGGKKTDKVKLVIDGTTLASLDFYYLNQYGMNRPEIYPVFITKYDHEFYHYAVGFSPMLTFNQSVLVNYSSKGGYEARVWAELFYALIV